MATDWYPEHKKYVLDIMAAEVIGDIASLVCIAVTCAVSSSEVVLE